MSFLNRLKAFDAYPKTLEDFHKKTTSGALISVVAGIFILWLLVSEFQYFLQTSESHELFVDSNIEGTFKVHLDVTFHKMSCNVLTLDVMDVSGDHQLGVVHNIFKKRLDNRGRVIEGAKEEKHLARDQVPVAPANVTADYCGPCYGAEETPGQCCNSCSVVRDLYRKKGWALGNVDRIEQCVREGYKPGSEAASGEGCNVFGYLEVRRVAGNFHFAPGQSFSQNHMHMHDLSSFRGAQFDMSHTINTLRFGEVIPSSSVTHPLNGHRRMGKVPNTMFQYYVKVVPTVYKTLLGSTVATNQYSVTEYDRELVPGKSHGLPGAFFFYDFSPIMIQISEKKKSFGHFLTGVCAIIGGVFTVAGMIDGMVYSSMRSLQKKIELGKTV